MPYDFFNKEAFEAEVIKDTKPTYRKDTPCTRCYEAMAKVEGVAAPWQFANIQAQIDCWNFILVLANRCFSHIWGVQDEKGMPLEEGCEEYAIKHLNDRAGAPNMPGEFRKCTWPDIDFKARQIGMEFYVSLLNLRTVKKKLEELVGPPKPGEAGATANTLAAIKADKQLNDEVKNALVTLVQAISKSK